MDADEPKPSISRRAYIKWFDSEGNGTASEPTSTLVLSVPKTNHFVDVRINRSALERHAASGDEGPLALEPDDLDWAFAGQSTSTDLTGGIYRAHKVFTHRVDSRYPPGTTPPADQGDVRDADDGTGDEIEVGAMVNPATGDLQQYEERWTEERLLKLHDEASFRCAVWQTDDPETETRGQVVIVGRYAQGIMWRDGKLYVERWDHRPESDQQNASETPDGGYVLVAILGKAGKLPGPDALWNRKELFIHEGIEWRVT